MKTWTRGGWVLAGLALAWWLIPVMTVGFRCLPLLVRKAPEPLPMPVFGVSRAGLRDTFEAPRGGGRRHRGVDVFAPRHTPILSPTEGVVVKVGEDRLGGRVVWMLAPGARWHYFAHLESFGELRPGQWVPRGFRLGTVGDSGNARGTPPHLHFGIYRLDGKALNPAPILNPGLAFDRRTREARRQ